MSDSTDAENALTVARWCWPEDSLGAQDCIRSFMEFDGDHRDFIAAAEAVVRERGLGEEYGRGLLGVLGFWRGLALLNFDEMATIATAPLHARLAALAAVAREAQRG